jgi:hypothetical protein
VDLTAQEPLQRFDADGSLAMAQLGERGRCKSDLRKRWKPFINETAKPAQRSTLGTLRIGCGEELA